MRHMLLSFASLLCISSSLTLIAQDKATPIAVKDVPSEQEVSFLDVLDILDAKCAACHSSVLKEGGLLLEEHDEILKGGKSGKIVVPGKPEKSLLFIAASRSGKPAMPPLNKKSFKPLTPEELGVLKRWIEKGAINDGDGTEHPEEINWINIPEHFRPILSVSLSPDGNLVAAGRGTAIEIFDVKSGYQVATLQGHRDIVQSLHFSPNGRYLASAGFRQVKLWNVPLATESGQFRSPMQRGISAHADGVTGVSLSGDGSTLASASLDQSIAIWNNVDKSLMRLIEGGYGPQRSVAVSSDGKLVAAGGNDGKLRLWSAADGQLLSEYAGHKKPVTSVRFSGNGQILISGSEDQTVRLWSLPSRADKWKVQAPASLIGCSPDGNINVTSDPGGKVRVVDAGGKAIAEYTLPRKPVALAVSADAKRFFITSPDNLLSVHNVADGTVVREWKVESQIRAASWSTQADHVLVVDGKGAVSRWNFAQDPPVAEVVSGIDQALTLARSQTGRIGFARKDRVVVWDEATKKVIREIQMPTGVVESVAISSDGKQLAVSESAKVPSLLVFDVETGKQTQKVATPEPATQIVFSGGGNTLFVILQGKTQSWDVQTGKSEPSMNMAAVAIAAHSGGILAGDGSELKSIGISAGAQLQELTGHAAVIHAVQTNNDASVVISTHANGNVVVWDRTTGKPGRVLAHGGGAVYSATLDASAERVASVGADKNLKIWSLSDGASLGTLTIDQPLKAVCFSPDGARVAAGDATGTCYVWSIGSSSLLYRFVGHQKEISSVVVTDEKLISSSVDRTVRTWNTTDTWAEVATLGPMIDRVISLAFSPDSSLLAAGSGEPSRSGQIKIWTTSDQKMVRELEEPHSDTVFGLEFSPDGRMLASAAADKMVKVFDLLSGKEVRKFEGHTHHVMDVSWKSDGNWLVSSGADNAMKVWDMQTGEQRRTINAHSKQITSVEFVAGGNQAVSSGGDALVRIYDTSNGRRIRDFNASGDFLYSLAVSTDGKVIASGGQNSVLRIWTSDGKLVREIKPPTPEGGSAKK